MRTAALSVVKIKQYKTVKALRGANSFRSIETYTKTLVTRCQNNPKECKNAFTAKLKIIHQNFSKSILELLQ